MIRNKDSKMAVSVLANYVKQNFKRSDTEEPKEWTWELLMARDAFKKGDNE